ARSAPRSTTSSSQRRPASAQAVLMAWRVASLSCLPERLFMTRNRGSRPVSWTATAGVSGTAVCQQSSFRYRAGVSTELTVLAAAAVVTGGLALVGIMLGLAGYAQAHPGQCLASGLRNGVAAFLAVGQARPRRQLAACPVHRILDAVFYLFLNGTVLRPTCGHVVLLRGCTGVRSTGVPAGRSRSGAVHRACPVSSAATSVQVDRSTWAEPGSRATPSAAGRPRRAGPRHPRSDRPAVSADS